VGGVDADIKPSSSSSSLNQDKARRPPLPTTSVGPAASFVISPPRTPLDSPNLATYRAPEELEAVAGPSGWNGYFDRDEVDKEVESSDAGNDSETEEDISEEKQAMEGEMDQFFGEGGRVVPPDLMAYSDTDEGDNEERGDEDEEDDQSETDADSVDSDGDEVDDDDDEADEEEANRLMLFNEDDWAVEVQVVQQPVGGGVGEEPAAQAAAEAVQPPAGAGGGPLDLNEEIEGNVEDDMDGAMEGKTMFHFILILLILAIQRLV